MHRLFDVVEAVHAHVPLIIFHPVALRLFFHELVVVISHGLQLVANEALLGSPLLDNGPLCNDASRVVVGYNLIVTLDRHTGVGLASVAPLVV